MSENDVKITKKFFISEAKMETLVAIFLGITALFTAWATWIGSLHGGNQATNYAKSNNIASEGNSMWNEATQLLIQDMLTWNMITEYQFDIEIAKLNGNDKEAELIEEKIDTLMESNASEQLVAGIEWLYNEAPETAISPFENEEIIDSYYTEAQAVLDEADAVLKEGQEDNAKGDAYNLATVFLSVVLFLLGIVGTFKRMPNRFVVFVVAVAILVFALIFMFKIPMPTGFNFASFFKY